MWEWGSEEWYSDEPETSVENDGWDDVTAYVNWYASPGQEYYIDAEHYYSFEYYEAGWSYDGYSQSEDVVAQDWGYPSGDTATFYSDKPDGVNGGVWGAVFEMFLDPESVTAYEGGRIDEYLDLDNTFDDSCHDQVVGYYVVLPPYKEVHVAMGVYGDEIYTGDDWVRYYSGLERTGKLICPCGWTVYQTYIKGLPTRF